MTGYAGPRKKVLVVDDVAENRAVATDMLTPLGFEVVEAANGREGLEMAQRLRPDLILMDIVMPEMDGLEATRRLRELPAFKDVPIIAMSASVSASDSEKFLAAGMNAFSPKPIDVDRLLGQIATVLQLDWVYELPEEESSSELDASEEVLVVPPRQEMEVLYRLARRETCRTSWRRRHTWPNSTRATVRSPANCACWPRATSPRPSSALWRVAWMGARGNDRDRHSAFPMRLKLNRYLTHVLMQSSSNWNALAKGVE